MSALDHRSLRQFLAVVDTGTVRAAADALNMSQPPLTTAIRQLEQRLGATLFERSVRGMQPTAAGALLARDARHVLARLDRLERDVRAAADVPRPLRVGFVSAALNGPLPRLLRALKAARRPTPSLMEMTTPEQVAALMMATIDVGLLHPPVEDAPSDLVVDILETDPFRVALPEDHPLASSRTLTIERVAGEPFVLFPEPQGPRLYARLRSTIAACGHRLVVAATARRVHTQLGLIAGGLGIGLVTASTAATLSFKGVVVRPLRGADASLSLELALAGDPSAVADCRTLLASRPPRPAR